MGILDAKARVSSLRDQIQDFCPDWISLQFVPYGYHPKGLPWSLGPLLQEISGHARRHIFFHELTLGLHREETLKNRAYGILQRMALRKLLNDWKPHALHTHTAPYLAWLKNHGHPAEALPLFGNIPIAGRPGNPPPVHPSFDEVVRDRKPMHPALLGGYFGTFYPGAGNPDFVERMRTFAIRSGKQIVLFLAGRQDPNARARWEHLAATSDDILRFIFLGELPDSAVSSYLQQLDFGVAATPFALIEKSGSVAAMRDHGLPMLVPRNDWTPRFAVPGNAPRNIFPAWGGHSLDRLPEAIHLRGPARESLPTVAQSFLTHLANHDD